MHAYLGVESTPEGIDGGGHFCHVGTFPIGIDADKVDKARQDESVTAKVKAIAEMYQGKKIIVGRDKLDLVKGVLQKLAAFERFLLEYPEWRNEVYLILYSFRLLDSHTDHIIGRPHSSYRRECHQRIDKVGKQSVRDSCTHQWYIWLAGVHACSPLSPSRTIRRTVCITFYR